MKIRKITGMVLAGSLVLSMTACGSGSSSSGTTSTTAAAAAEASGTETEAAADAAEENSDAAEWDQEAEFEKALATMDLSNVIDGVDSKDLTMSTHCSETDSNYLYALAFEQAVETLSGGQMQVELYANGQLFGQSDALQALQQGTLDIANSDTALLANYDPAAGILDIPFLMKNREQALKCVQDEEISDFINSMIEPSGMHLLSVLPLNFRNSLVKNMDIATIDDFKGLIMRTPEAPHTIAAFEAIGATPTVIPSGEAYTAVQTGVADGLEGHAEYMVLQKFGEVAQNYVQTQHVFTFTDYVMSKSVYDSLTDAQKQVIDEASKLAQSVHIAYTAELYPAMYAELESEGVKITEFDTAPFIEATEDYRNNYIEENNLQDLVEKINAYE
ncbi:MAG: TRAP transporter substrate-binding protein [Clostridiales bacterium]|nr:TRAP transporter substrate-binding protein [Clostridiales bacterium]